MYMYMYMCMYRCMYMYIHILSSGDDEVPVLPAWVEVGGGHHLGRGGPEVV